MNNILYTNYLYLNACVNIIHDSIIHTAILESIDNFSIILIPLIILFSILLGVVDIRSRMIHYSGPAKKAAQQLGGKIIYGLGVGASAGGTYIGVREIINDAKKLTGSSDTKNTGESSSKGKDTGSNNGNNDKNGKK